MKTRILSVLLAVCMLVSLFPAAFAADAETTTPALTLDQDYMFMIPDGIDFISPVDGEVATWETSDEAVAIIEDGLVMAMGAGTATITAYDADGNSASVCVYVKASPHFYYNLGKGYYGPYSSSATAFTEMTYAKTTKGSPDEQLFVVREDYPESGLRYSETDPWAAGTLGGAASAAASSNFPVGSAQTTLNFRGYDFKAPTLGEDYISVLIKVPADGTYDIVFDHAKHTPSPAPTVYYAAAGVGFEGATELGELDTIHTALSDDHTTTFEAIDLTAGEYEFFFSGCSVFWVDGIRLNNVDAPVPEFAISSTEVVYGETITPIYTGLDGYTPVLSTDSDLITINDDGTVTAGNKTGLATLTLSCEEYPFITTSMNILVSSTMFYNYMKFSNFGIASGEEPWMRDYSTSTSQMKSGSADDIGATTSYGWKIGAISDGITRDWIWSVSARSLGPYFAGAAGSTAEIIIDVPVDGKFAVISKHSPWSGASNSAYDLYIAPSDAADPVAAEYKLTASPLSNQSTVSGNHETGKEDYAGVVELTAGEYIVSYKVTTQGSGFFVWGLKLRNVLDPIAATSLTLSKEHNGVLFVNDTLNLIPAMQPAAAAATNIPVYTSSDEDVVTVENGVVTAVGAGTATVTATVGELESSVEITVASDLLDFKFQEVGAAYNGTGSGTTVFKGNADFTGTYDGSQTGDLGSAKWQIVDVGDGLFQSDKTYGTFIFGSTSASSIYYLKLKIQIDEDGEYLPGAKRQIYGSSAPAKVYIAPADATNPTDSTYYVYTISDAGSAVEAAARDEAVMLKAGEYILTFYQIAPSAADRYLCLHNFYLYNVGAYEEVKVSEISLSTKTPAIAVGETAALSATVAPANAVNKDLAWSTSDANIATVDGGVVTGVANGVATITATATDGSGVSATYDIVVGGTYVYDFVKTATSMPNYVEGETYKVQDSAIATDYEASMLAGSAPWYIASRSGADFTYNSVNAAYGAFLFGAKNQSGNYITLKIQVGADGVYTGALRFSDYTGTAPFKAYLAPVGATATAAEYQIMDYTPDYGSLTQKSALFEGLYLAAGEYNLTFVQNGSTTSGFEDRYLTAKYFSLTKTADLGLSTIEGAQIRTEGVQGLRFISQIDKVLADNADIVEYGTVLMPTDDLAGDINNLVVGYTAENGHSALVVPAVNTYKDLGDSLQFTALIYNIPETAYTQSITARAYVKLANGAYYYGSTSTARSIYEVAQNGLASDTATDAEKEVFQAIVDAVSAN